MLQKFRSNQLQVTYMVTLFVWSCPLYAASLNVRQLSLFGSHTCLAFLSSYFVVSDIAIFVLKTDVKLQLTN